MMTGQAALPSARKESVSKAASQSVILQSSCRMSGLEMPNLPSTSTACPARKQGVEDTVLSCAVMTMLRL